MDTSTDLFDICCSVFKERLISDGNNLLSELFRIGIKCLVLSGELSGAVLTASFRLIGCGINVYPPLSAIIRTVFPCIEHQPMAIKFPPIPTPPLRKAS